jgi:hypothetical protein
MGLSISSGSGTQQAGTQSPQNSVGSGVNTEAGSNVQPGTATSLLTTTSGIALTPSQLPTINVNESAQPSTSTNSVATTTVQPKHYISGGLLGVSIGLFIIALVVFWVITRSAKTTTNY